MSNEILKGVTRPGASQFVNPNPHVSMGFHSRVNLECWGPDENGNYVMKQKATKDGNLFVTGAANRLIEMLASDSDGASDFVSAGAIGTDTTAVGYSDDALGASTQIVHLSQASMVASDAGARTLAYNMTFASDGNASAIHEVGLFWTNNATTNMVARSVLGTASVNRGASDEIRVTYNLIAGSC